MNISTPQAILGSTHKTVVLPRPVITGQGESSKPGPAEALVPNELRPVVRLNGLEGKPESLTVQKAAEHLRDAAKRTNAYFRHTDTRLEFEVGEKTGRTIIRVRDKETGEIIREIPPEELVRISIRMGELHGLLFDEES